MHHVVHSVIVYIIQNEYVLFVPFQCTAKHINSADVYLYMDTRLGTHDRILTQLHLQDTYRIWAYRIDINIVYVYSYTELYAYTIRMCCYIILY